MIKSFSVVDSINNSVKECTFIVKFNYQNNDFLVYSYMLDDNNCCILVSKIILDVNNNYVINNISLDDKTNLNNLVYNLVIMLPSKESDMVDSKSLINDFCSKYSLTVSNSCPITGEQTYFSNCEIANTSINVLENASKFYQKYVSESDTSSNLVNSAVWEVPSASLGSNNISNIDSFSSNSGSDEAVIPINVSDANNNHISDLGNINIILPNQSISSEEVNNNMPSNLNFNDSSSVNAPLNGDFNFKISGDTSINTSGFDQNNNIQSNLSNNLVQDNMNSLPNPQKQILSSLDNGVNNNFNADVNVYTDENKNAGFASSKYIIIGTICLILAAAVVFLAIIFIKNR